MTPATSVIGPVGPCSPGMNFVPGALSVADSRLRFDGAGLSLELDDYPFARPPEPGQRVKLGVRPEYVKLVSGSFYDPVRDVPPYGIGKYIFIFNLPGTPLPIP